MLGFILSKMQMLLFATGIFVVAILMYNFVSGLELRDIASSQLILESKIIEEQLGVDSICSFKSIYLPERINYGITNTSLLYDLDFSKQSTPTKNILTLSLVEHGTKGIIYSKSIETELTVFLLSPEFMFDNEMVSDSYLNADTISLYPRTASKGPQAMAPNSFIALKNGEKSELYIIPCSSMIKESNSPSNCIANIIRVGCFALKKEKGTPADSDIIPTCFDITRELGERAPVKWIDCKNYGYAQ